MQRLFDHEKLEVYQASLALIVWLEPILQKLPKSLSVIDQLDRASTSIPLNIAEGNGKFTSADRCRFFDIARGSALESAALDVLVAKGRASAQEVFAWQGSTVEHRIHVGGLNQSQFRLPAPRRFKRSIAMRITRTIRITTIGKIGKS